MSQTCKLLIIRKLPIHMSVDMWSPKCTVQLGNIRSVALVFVICVFMWNKVNRALTCWLVLRPFRCSHVAEDSDLLGTVCTVFSGTACPHQPPGAVPWQKRLVRGQEHHTDSRAHRMSASLYSKQVRMKALSVSFFLCLTISLQLKKWIMQNV